MNRKSLSALTLVFIAFAGLPVLYTLGTALSDAGLIFKNSQAFSGQIFPLLAKSCGIAFFIALFSTLFGTALGFLLYKINIPFRGFFKIAILIPLFLSPYILAVAWKDLFFILSGDTSFVASYFGVVMVLTFVYTPFSMLVIGGALAKIDSQLEESGIMITKFGNSALKIVLPMIKPALVSSFVLVFIFGVSEFSVPAFLGIRTFTTEIFTQFSAYYNHELAVLQSSLVVLIAVLLLMAEGKYIADAPFFSIGGKGVKSKIYDIKEIKIISAAFPLIWFLVSAVLPFAALLSQSLSGKSGSFANAFNLLLPTFGSSIRLAFIGGAVILLIGFAGAFVSSNRGAAVLSKLFDWTALVLFAIPSIILGVALIKFYNRPALNLIYSGWGIIIIAYVGKYSFISAKIIGNSIKQIPASLNEAAILAGASESARIRKILLPLISPSLFAAFVIGFIFSLGELGATIMLYPPGTEIMPIKVFTIMANAPQSLTSSMTLIVFSVTLLLISGFFLAAKLFVKNTGGAND